MAHTSGQAAAFEIWRRDAPIFRQGAPTGKGGANAISDPNRTPFTTRPRLAWIFDLRPTSAQSRTTQYTRDRDSFDWALDRLVVGLVGLD